MQVLRKSIQNGILDLYLKAKGDIQQLQFENNCLKEDIKNMYCEEAILTILQDEFDLTRAEAQNILKEY